jgi:hypothetical protein
MGTRQNLRWRYPVGIQRIVGTTDYAIASFLSLNWATIDSADARPPLSTVVLWDYGADSGLRQQLP